MITQKNAEAALISMVDGPSTRFGYSISVEHDGYNDDGDAVLLMYIRDYLLPLGPGAEECFEITLRHKP
jgi:hypothetical protein